MKPGAAMAARTNRGAAMAAKPPAQKERMTAREVTGKPPLHETGAKEEKARTGRAAPAERLER
jgi:hypothetical protein